jgi:hypothetical protein
MKEARLELRLHPELRDEIHARIPFGLRHEVAVKFYEVLMADIRQRGPSVPVMEVLEGTWSMKGKV